MKVLSIEDMLLWRLREWVHRHHASGFHQAAHLLVSDEVDTERLDRRAQEEGLRRALRELRRLTAEVEAGRVVEKWEIAELGKDIEGLPPAVSTTSVAFTERSCLLAPHRHAGGARRPVGTETRSRVNGVSS